MPKVVESDAVPNWHQSDLPPLPLPQLSDTLERYLKTVRPLLTDAEFAHTTAVVTDFQREGGEGETLQAFLEEKAGSERNWMEEWWEQLAYLRTRTTMAIHINWFGVFPEWGFPIDKVSAATAMLDGMLKTRARIEKGEYPVEEMRGNPLDMHQFTRIFGMTRVPATDADELVQKADSRHVAVMRDGAIIILDVYSAAGAPLGIPELRAALTAALAMADAAYELENQASEGGKEDKRDGSVVGTHTNTSLLTALDRNVWATERAALLADPTSAASLQLVESAICCITFSRETPSSQEEASRLCHGGSCRNLWFDKSFTCMVFENGKVGINAEHTPVDAMAMLSLMMNAMTNLTSVLKDPAQRAALLGDGPQAAPASPPKLLQWRLPSSARVAIEDASCQVVRLASDVDLCHMRFLHFGKSCLKRLKLHPDFFMQMAVQLAMYRAHRVFCATYETGHTRAFYHGRTDTIRTCSEESTAWVKCMEDPHTAPEEKHAALKAACAAHGEQVQRVLTGQGIDRHLLGLYIAAHLQGVDPLPAVFSDKAYKLSGGGGNYRVSTSNVGYTPLFGGFAPMTADGYGVCYSMLEGRMNVMITSWKSCPETSSTRFRDTLSQVLMDMRELCTNVAAASSSKL